MNRLELLNIEGQGYTVIVDDKFCSHLGIDEALGCVAGALFGDKVMFVQTYEAWLSRERRYKHCTLPESPAGLLEYRPVAELQRVEHQWDHLLSVVDDLKHSISQKEPRMKGIMTKCDGNHALTTLCTDRQCWQGDENPMVRLYEHNDRLIGERKAYADAILTHLAGIISTPESGYLNDGGVRLAARDLDYFRKMYNEHLNQLLETEYNHRNDRTKLAVAMGESCSTIDVSHLLVVACRLKDSEDKHKEMMQLQREHGDQWLNYLIGTYIEENDLLSDVSKNLTAVRDQQAEKLKDSLFRLIDLQNENAALRQQLDTPLVVALQNISETNAIAAATAHRACCGTEHDPLQGKLHGYCVVCGVPWPCETAKVFLVGEKAAA